MQMGQDIWLFCPITCTKHEASVCTTSTQTIASCWRMDNYVASLILTAKRTESKAASCTHDVQQHVLPSFLVHPDDQPAAPSVTRLAE